MALPIPHRTYQGVVVSAGKMDRTVKVRIAAQTWNKKVQKYFSTPKHHLVHDPANSVREGDVVTIQSGWRKAQHVRHVIASIVSPFGTPVSERPHLPTIAEYRDMRQKKRLEKDMRQTMKGRVPSKRRVVEARETGVLAQLGVQMTKEVALKIRSSAYKMRRKVRERQETQQAKDGTQTDTSNMDGLVSKTEKMKIA